ncbi:MAG: metal-sensitive transcriptional regulator [Acidithiobacillus sp.]|uniref:metal-sensitive transcriptional regulator n=1 Tax=Acidithiobacillus sp. TaxID=1872118 RepID=UPI0025BDFADE|nr:metal-sensitive transcriptional regulator [Acidithiobacillus sp.]
MSTHDRRAILNRFARLEGQLRGIRQMLESDRDCPEVLNQMAAARAALDKIARLVFEDHLDHCLLDAVQRGDAEDSIVAIKAAFARYFTP